MKKMYLWRFLSVALLSGVVFLAGCGTSSEVALKLDSDGDGADSADGERATVAFVTNQIAGFWNIAQAGCLDAQKDFDVNVEVKMPIDPTAVEQQRIIEDLLTSGIKGLAVSPLDSDNQQQFLDKVAADIPLITHDSDAPNTNRLMYIGMDNYLAGRKCGELVKEAIPDGGKVLLFIGRLEQNNSKHRRQGVIDELLDRSPDPSRFDPQGEEIVGEKYTVLATLTDQGKPDIAKQKPEDAINTYTDVNCMVGLFEYNPPAILDAVKEAGKTGEIKVVGFDENEVTLQAIKDGECVGTVVQNPYEYGYQSVKILASLIKGDDSVIPESKFVDIPARKITAENVDSFWADLNAKKGG